MPHSIGLGMIGKSELSDRLLEGILRNNVVSGKNIHIAEKDAKMRDHYLGLGVDCTPDVSASMLRSEIMILSGVKKEFSTMLSSFCGTTRGRGLERVAKATHVVCVESREEDGRHVSHLTYSSRFPNHMKSAVEDIFRSIGDIETEQL